MSYFLCLLALCFIMGFVGVAANPSPYYGAVGLVVCVVGGCGGLVSFGGSFLGLVLFLIYLGGMLVVFAYSVALAAEPYPETWGDYYVFLYVAGYLMGVVCLGVCLVEAFGLYGFVGLDGGGVFDLRTDLSGVVLLFFSGGPLLLLCGWGLLLALFVVLELVRGGGHGSLRVP
uniref:NADH-ubiquinone oxidoreductase chain 6 n=1 Tax=Tenuidactylus dadunensis TaxID=3079921 RepID=A0AA96ZQW1_9SAUR|nr:NADH dehydrogenase subunit 6 [Tenuidactylus dadunensis]WNX96104.1 NADH dehydrogenase subunit 6 [Tenuidactylus dadunensis]